MKENAYYELSSYVDNCRDYYHKTIVNITKIFKIAYDKKYIVKLYHKNQLEPVIEGKIHQLINSDILIFGNYTTIANITLKEGEFGIVVKPQDIDATLITIDNKTKTINLTSK